MVVKKSKETKKQKIEKDKDALLTKSAMMPEIPETETENDEQRY